MTDHTARKTTDEGTVGTCLQGTLFGGTCSQPHYYFQSFGSGSCGNCSILTYKDTSLLIDLGIGARLFAKILKEQCIDPYKLKGILVTHDHADHIRGVAPYASRHDLPVYATHEVVHTFLNNKFIRQDLSGHIRRINPGEIFHVGEMMIESFPVPHDASANVGYSISTEAGVFTIITDIGHITEEIEHAIRRSNFLVFESNYDEEMLWTGRYPQHLKERITNGRGHLSNRLSAETIARLYHANLRFLALCHLSGDNNTPDLALGNMDRVLTANGVDTKEKIKILVLRRGEISPRYVLY